MTADETAPSPAEIEVQGVSHAVRTGFLLRRKVILSDITLRIARGSLCGIVGPNGAGKTTLLGLLAGLTAPLSGTVRVAGLPASSLEAKRTLGFLPERPFYPEHLTGEGLLRYVGALSGLSRAESAGRIRLILGRVGLGGAAAQRLRAYSKGMLQRIGIAQLLMHDSRVLVLDEPMSGLDPFGRARMKDLIGEMQAEGRTIVLSTHALSDIDALCTDVALLSRGRLSHFGPIASLPNLETLFDLGSRQDS